MNEHGLCIVSHSDKVVLRSGMPNMLTTWKNTGKLPSTPKLLAMIETLMSTTDFYNLPNGMETLREIVRQHKILVLFKLTYKCKRAQMYKTANSAPVEVNLYKKIPMFSDSAINDNWDKYGHYLGGYDGFQKSY